MFCNLTMLINRNEDEFAYKDLLFHTKILKAKKTEVPWRELGGLQSRGSVRSKKKINLKDVVRKILKVLSFRFFHVFMSQGNYWPTHLHKSHEKNTLYLNKVKMHYSVNDWKKLPVSSFTSFWNGNPYNGF